jgi:hypothetical protein
MSPLKHLAILGAIALATTACTQQASPEPATAAPAAPTSSAPAAKPVPARRAVAMMPVSLDLLSRNRHNAPLSCNLEVINNQRIKNEPFVVNSKVATFGGWYLPEISKKPGTKAYLRLVDESGSAGWEGEIRTWTNRPDISAMAVEPGNAGFAQAFDLSPLPPGRYQMSVVFEDTGLRSCDKNQVLEIK